MKYLGMVAATAVVLLASPNANAIERQLASNWCWAAAIEDVVDDYGVATSQVEIAARLDGWPRDRPASLQEVTALLQSYGLRASIADRPATAMELTELVDSGGQVIAFVRPMNGPVGHYIVLDDADVLGNVRVSDPATGHTTIQSVADLYFAWRWVGSVVIHGSMTTDLDEERYLDDDGDDESFFEPRYAPPPRVPVCFTVWDTQIQTSWEFACNPWGQCGTIPVQRWVQVPVQVCE